MGRRDRSPDRDECRSSSQSRSRSRSRSRTPKGKSERKSGRNRVHKDHKQERERHVSKDKRQVSRRRSRSASKERPAIVKRRKEECLKARDNLEDYCYDLKSELKTSPISVEIEKTILSAVNSALELIDDDSKQNAEEFVAALKDLENICYPITNMLAQPVLEQLKTSDSDDNPDIKERAILRAEVVAIQPYGVFVQLGRYHRGLVHISQVDAALEFNREDADDEKVWILCILSVFKF
ncbi:hypothetical protein CYMTET_40459 [Cymbomonas tetramitiformis]|uniref:S1 motif domain-containing protein n=1 Tax=Cymbomonas tetramitiformis TaxID=36881 RepID=A0AAE0F4L2_9CHLO|nr:hypothetical protein CYMTET_40459 [Cymbomonas tetramitiformis]